MMAATTVSVPQARMVPGLVREEVCGFTLKPGTSSRSSSPVMLGTSWRQERDRRYRLQRQSQAMLTSMGVQASITGCMKGVKKRKVNGILEERLDVMLREDAEKGWRASYSGMATCDSLWSCWVCAPKRAAEKIEETRLVSKELIDSGYCYVFVTFTAQHSADTDLSDFSKGFSKSYREMSSTTAFKSIMKSIYYVGSIMSAEVTDDNPELSYDEKTGWHYHRHYVYFIKRPYLSEYEVEWLHKMLLKEWKYNLEKNGLTCNSHGVDVSDNSYKTINDPRVSVDKISSYLGKAAAFELCGAALDTKDGCNERRINPWQLNIMAIDGNKIAKNRYLEFYKAMKGKTFLRISKELRSLVDIKKIEKERTGSKDDGIRVLSFYTVGKHDTEKIECDMAWYAGPSDAWLPVSQQGRLGVLLTVVELAWKEGLAAGLSEAARFRVVQDAAHAVCMTAAAGFDCLTMERLPYAAPPP